MSATIVNAAPMSIMHGTQDLSTAKLPIVPEALPSHLPKFYIYAQKGPTDQQMVSGADLVNMYGIDSFDMRKKWANHATVYANAINAKGNALMVERVRPDDAGPNASITLYLDVLSTNIPLYQRNTDGSYKLDVSNNPIPVVSGATVPGYICKWVSAPTTVDLQGNVLFGSMVTIPGDQVDQTTLVQSERFPIMDLEVSHFGDYGNNIGMRMWAPTTMSANPIDARLITNTQAYPFRMACVRRPDAKSTPTLVPTQSNETFVNITFRPNTIDINSDANVGIKDVFIKSYQMINNPGYTPQYGPFGRLYLYQDNVDLLLGEFLAAELPNIDAFSDITGTINPVEEKYVVNMVSGVSSNGVPYASLLFSESAGSIRLTENTTIYAKGGSDGTMNDALFGASVANLVAEYADPNSVKQNMAKYPESIMYDSGFPLTTKYAMASFIAIRKDTAVIISTHDVNGPQLTASQESSLAIALRTRLQMFPESDYYGTSAMRAMIVGRSGTLLNSQYNKPLPLSLEIAVKAASYMGAGNGVWKSNFSFDSAPNNIVSMFTDINVTFTPAAVRNKDWANGLVWVESFDRRSYYFPALKTIYDNDTSVLNSFFTMMAVVELEKVGERARLAFSGISSLTNLQLAARVNKFVLDNTSGRFDGRFVIRPNTYFTEADIARGYSWRLDIKIFAPSMKTVQTLSIQSYRLDNLPKA